MLRFSIIASLSFLLACSNIQDEPTGQVATYILDQNNLPNYEGNLDHAQLINNLDEVTLQRGEIIYRTTCYSCHGDQHQPGSLPNSRKFWSEPFNAGSDPYMLYQTITRGFGQMPPQVQLVPSEKYDVIHFIRETFIKELRPVDYFEVSDPWLANLPKGDTLGPASQPYHPWQDMNYGNWLMRCYELADHDAPPKMISGGPAPLPNEDYSMVNFAYKGIAIRLNPGEGGIAKGQAFSLFDHDLLRMAGVWTGHGFIDFEDILLDDQHNVYPRTVGNVQAANPITPGWANPKTGLFEDPRIRGLDGRPFGPLPREWSHYKGLYKYNDQVIIKYSVDKAIVYETHQIDTIDGAPIFSRIINISENARSLKMRIFPTNIPVQLISDHAVLTQVNGFHILNIPKGQPCKVRILFARNKFSVNESEFQEKLPDLTNLIYGGSKHPPEKLTTSIISANGHTAYEVDIFSLPFDNPYKSRMRPTGIDFINKNEDAVVCTIDGEVWKITGITKQTSQVIWQRIATGLFQPLGIKVLGDKIYVGCRDQIVQLHDLNGDEEIDFYESFNSDHQVTEHFHEFAMGLQADQEGNFYYAKSGRHARTSLVPQHGTLIKVSSEGQTSTIVANGFRAANGVCLNPDGSFFVTDQEGYWNPMNRINRVEPGGFYGNMWGYDAPLDTSDQAMQMPLCWIDMKYDRSPAELLWVESDRWGPLNGSLLSLSYGYGKIFVVLTQHVDEVYQGGIVELPVPQFPTGLIRGRFNPSDGQLYTCGMSAWATSQMLQTGGLYRVRYNAQKSISMPIKMQFLKNCVVLGFSEKLEKVTANQLGNYQIDTWELKRTHRYGSDRYDTRTLKINAVDLSADQLSVTIHLEQLSPTWVIQIQYQLRDIHQQDIKGSIQGTLYRVPNDDVISKIRIE
ncbi:MAG: c-type cytochrome [Saprospiraceae bacterium]|nr:c-type cytochrome [Saprospiraceae bacterium]